MSNFACPECEVTLRHNARWCGCGWGKGSRGILSDPEIVQANAEYKAELERRNTEYSAECRVWLDQNGVTRQGMAQPFRMKAMADYRRMLKNTMRKADVHPKAWAHSLKSDYIDGARLLPIQIAAASEALHETWNNRQCTPRATS